jgi:transcriptional regulator with XRE-family HTH domain
MSEFGEILRQKRRDAGVSQRKLAEQAGVDFSYVSKLENGRLPPPAADTVRRFASVLHCPVEELLAAAKKIPSDVGDTLSAQPGALRFLQAASAMELSENDWEHMIGTLHELGSDAKRGRKR